MSRLGNAGEVKSPGRNSIGSTGEAEDALSELRSALQDVGVVLPSLGVDAVGLCNEPPAHPVELGRVNVGTARKLAAVLRNGAAEEDGETRGA